MIDTGEAKASDAQAQYPSQINMLVKGAYKKLFERCFKSYLEEEDIGSDCAGRQPIDPNSVQVSQRMYPHNNEKGL